VCDRQRFVEAVVEGLSRDRTRKPGNPPIPAITAAPVVAPTPQRGLLADGAGAGLYEFFEFLEGMG
jgi:hypothetical protein